MKIAFTIYNPALISNWVERLLPFMKDLDFVVFHIGTLQECDPKILHGVTYYDVSHMSFKEIDQIITDTRPALWISMSFRSVLELFFQRLCIHHGIPQLYLQHGFFSRNTVHFNTVRAKRSLKTSILRQLYSLTKYVEMGLNNGHLSQDLGILHQVYIKGNFNASPFNHYYIYSQREYEFLSTIYNVKKEDVSIIGYPFFSDEDEKKRYLIKEEMDGEVLYVHQPFISDGFADITYEEEKCYLLTIERAILKKYKGLVILLHPRENLKEYIERFSDTNIRIVQSPNNPAYFASKSLVLGHYSTALLYALYFDRPTVILEYPTSKNDPLFEEIFPTITNIEDLCNENIEINVSKKQYMAGDVNTYEHIAKEIKNLIIYM